MALSILAFVLAVFVLAGFTKGIIGLGLPTISMGLLAIVLSPVEAAALLILPSLVTNPWQMLDGPHLTTLLRRLWPLNLGVCVGTWLGASFLSGLGGPYAAPAPGWRPSGSRSRLRRKDGWGRWPGRRPGRSPPRPASS